MPEADRNPFLGLAEDGKAEYNFHQSWLEDFVLCNERARGVPLLEEVPPKPEADLGTSFHDGVQYLVENPDASWVEGYQLASETWAGFDHELDYDKGDAYLYSAMHSFEYQAREELVPVATEFPFRRLPFYEDDVKRIYVSGTIDYVDNELGLVDWKTSSRQYKPWEKQRWNGQASLYTWAWTYLTYGFSVGEVIPDEPVPFTFFVFEKPHGTLQRVTVYRDEGDWDWMRLRCRNAVTLIEANLEHWPVNDQHALCSPKWCPMWDHCKGHFVSVDWPRKAKQW